MPDRFFKQMLNPWTMGLSCIIWTCLGALLWATDLPSGLPDDLSDSSPFQPCLGRLYGEPPPRCPWYFQSDAIFLRRDRIDSLALQTLGNQGNVVLSTDGIDAPFRAGPKFMLGHTFGESRWQIDGTYFMVDNWDDSASVRDFTANPIPPGGNGNMFSPFSNFGQPTPNNNYDYNNLVSVREFSQLRNCELNLRYTLPMPHECLTPKLILGLRYIDIHEQFDYTSQSSTELTNVSISTRTTNDLFGPQIGGEFYFYVYQHCWIDLSIKGALCDNRALQETDENFSRRARDATAYVGDLDLDLVWQITPRLLTRIGYQALWVNNIAMAARNLARPETINEADDIDTTIDTVGRAVYHGPHIGLEFNW